MIAKITPRGSRTGDIAGYLHGPGRFNEHSYIGRDGQRRSGGMVIAGTAGRIGDTKGVGWAMDLRRAAQTPTASGRETVSPIWHTSLSAADEDRHLTDREWADAAQTFAREMRFDSMPWVAVRHGDGHIHIVVSRVDHAGRVWWGKDDRDHALHAAAAVEHRYQLRQAIPHERLKPRPLSRQFSTDPKPARRDDRKAPALSPVVVLPQRPATPTSRDTPMQPVAQSRLVGNDHQPTRPASTPAPSVTVGRSVSGEPVQGGRMSETGPDYPAAVAEQLSRDVPFLAAADVADVREHVADFVDAGWSTADIKHALDRRPDGAPWRPLPTDIRHPAAFMRSRLDEWRDPDNNSQPLPSHTQQRETESAAQQQRREGARRSAQQQQRARASEQEATRQAEQIMPGYRTRLRETAQRRAEWIRSGKTGPEPPIPPIAPRQPQREHNKAEWDRFRQQTAVYHRALNAAAARTQAPTDQQEPAANTRSRPMRGRRSATETLRQSATRTQPPPDTAAHREQTDPVLADAARRSDAEYRIIAERLAPKHPTPPTTEPREPATARPPQPDQGYDARQVRDEPAQDAQQQQPHPSRYLHNGRYLIDTQPGPEGPHHKVLPRKQAKAIRHPVRYRPPLGMRIREATAKLGRRLVTRRPAPFYQLADHRQPTGAKPLSLHRRRLINAETGAVTRLSRRDAATLRTEAQIEQQQPPRRPDRQEPQVAEQQRPDRQEPQATEQQRPDRQEPQATEQQRPDRQEPQPTTARERFAQQQQQRPDQQEPQPTTARERFAQQQQQRPDQQEPQPTTARERFAQQQRPNSQEESQPPTTARERFEAMKGNRPPEHKFAASARDRFEQRANSTDGDDAASDSARERFARRSAPKRDEQKPRTPRTQERDGHER